MSAAAPRPGKHQVAAALAALYVIWGSTYLAMRFAVQGFSPFRMAGIRFTLAGGALFSYLLVRRTPMPTLRQARNALGAGVLMLVLGNGLVAVAEQWVASSIAAVMIASMPLFAALFAGFFGVWPTRRESVGLLLGSVGVVLLNLDGGLRANPLGALMLLLAPAAWALGSVVSSKVDLPKGLMTSALQMLLCGVFMLALSFILPTAPGVHPDLKSTLALGYLVVFGSLVAFTAYGFLLRNVRPALATSYAFVNPGVAVLLGVGLAHETLTAKAYLGMGFIIAAVVMTALFRAGPTPLRAAPPDVLRGPAPRARG